MKITVSILLLVLWTYAVAQVKNDAGQKTSFPPDSVFTKESLFRDQFYPKVGHDKNTISPLDTLSKYTDKDSVVITINNKVATSDSYKKINFYNFHRFQMIRRREDIDSLGYDEGIKMVINVDLLKR